MKILKSSSIKNLSNFLDNIPWISEDKIFLQNESLLYLHSKKISDSDIEIDHAIKQDDIFSPESSDLFKKNMKIFEKKRQKYDKIVKSTFPLNLYHDLFNILKIYNSRLINDPEKLYYTRTELNQIYDACEEYIANFETLKYYKQNNSQKLTTISEKVYYLRILILIEIFKDPVYLRTISSPLNNYIKDKIYKNYEDKKFMFYFIDFKTFFAFLLNNEIIKLHEINNMIKNPINQNLLNNSKYIKKNPYKSLNFPKHGSSFIMKVYKDESDSSDSLDSYKIKFLYDGKNADVCYSRIELEDTLDCSLKRFGKFLKKHTYNDWKNFLKIFPEDYNRRLKKFTDYEKKIWGKVIIIIVNAFIITMCCRMKPIKDLVNDPDDEEIEKIHKDMTQYDEDKSKEETENLRQRQINRNKLKDRN